MTKRQPAPRKKSAPKNRKFTDAALRSALRKHDGLLAEVARSFKCSRQAVHTRINNNPDLLELVQDLRSGQGDLAESVLTYRMRRYKDREAAKFVLASRFKDRGYGQQPEIEPPPPDTSRRATIINVLVQMLDQKAAAMHHAPQPALTPPPVINGSMNGHNRPVQTNGHASPAQQLLAAKRSTNGKGG